MASAASLILIGNGNTPSSTDSFFHWCLAQAGLQPLPAPGTEERSCRGNENKLCGLDLDRTLAGGRHSHAHLQGCSQPAPAVAFELGQSTQCHMTISKKVVLGAPQK